MKFFGISLKKMKNLSYLKNIYVEDDILNKLEWENAIDLERKFPKIIAGILYQCNKYS